MIKDEKTKNYEAAFDALKKAQESDHGFLLAIDENNDGRIQVYRLSDFDIAVQIVCLYQTNPEIEKFVNEIKLRVQKTLLSTAGEA